MTSAFTPIQELAILAAAGAAVLLAAWNILRAVRSRGRGAGPMRYGPIGLAAFLLSFAFVAIVAVCATPFMVRHPLWVLMVPIVGALACAFACSQDQEKKRAVTAELPPDPTMTHLQKATPGQNRLIRHHEKVLITFSGTAWIVCVVTMLVAIVDPRFRPALYCAFLGFLAVVIFSVFNWRCPVCKRAFTRQSRGRYCENCNTRFDA